MTLQRSRGAMRMTCLLGQLHKLHGEVVQDGSALRLCHCEQRVCSVLHCSTINIFSTSRYIHCYTSLCAVNPNGS